MPACTVVPGYGSGSSFLFKLFDGLSAAFRLHAVDLLGTGLSGEARPGAASTDCAPLGPGHLARAGGLRPSLASMC
jgi:pimeloyl-ACP methyl ester carboxylesterase